MGTNTYNKGFISAYCSHSYDVKDRPINLYFWKLFFSNQFMFNIDPKSNFLSIPYLEKMMQRSGCFIAIIPFREEQRKFRCSPYILFEYGLSIHHNKPKLLLLEDRISAKPFEKEKYDFIVFNRNNLQAKEREFENAILRLAEQSRGAYELDTQLHGRVLFILDESTLIGKFYSKRVLAAIKKELDSFGYELVVYKPKFENTYELCIELKNTDFVIIEQRIDLISPWISSFIHARAIPSIRVNYTKDVGSNSNFTPIMSKYAKLILNDDSKAVICWENQADLTICLSRHLRKLEQQRIVLNEEQLGERYFKSIGRLPAQVFISNADENNELARRLSNALKIENIDFFQYKEKDAIKVGDIWKETLRKELNNSAIFVALIDKNYLNKRWCNFELNIAKELLANERMKILPYYLDKSVPTAINEIEGREFYDLSLIEIVRQIVEDVDQALQEKS